MYERQHIYEDLNESSSARPGGSQQLEIPPSPIEVSGRQTFLPTFWLGAEIFAGRGDFNARQGSIVPLYFYQAPIFCIPA